MITEIDRLNALLVERDDEIASLKKTIEWYQAQAAQMMGAAARAEIAGASVQGAGEVPSLTETQREAVRDALSAALGDAMDCTRTWEAWGVGTMTEDDFELVADNDERLDELTAAVEKAIAAAPAAPLPAQSEQSATDWRIYHSALSRCAELLDNMADNDALIDTPIYLAEKLAALARASTDEVKHG